MWNGTCHTHVIHIHRLSSLTLALQAKAIDIVQAVEHASTLKNVLSDVLSHVNIPFHAMYERSSSQPCSDLHSGTTISTEMC